MVVPVCGIDKITLQAECYFIIYLLRLVIFFGQKFWTIIVQEDYRGRPANQKQSIPRPYFISLAFFFFCCPLFLYTLSVTNVNMFSNVNKGLYFIMIVYWFKFAEAFACSEFWYSYPLCEHLVCFEEESKNELNKERIATISIPRIFFLKTADLKCNNRRQTEENTCNNVIPFSHRLWNSGTAPVRRHILPSFIIFT